MCLAWDIEGVCTGWDPLSLTMLLPLACDDFVRFCYKQDCVQPLLVLPLLLVVLF